MKSPYGQLYPIYLDLSENYQKPKNISSIIQLLKSDMAYDILDNSNAPYTTFQSGGCWILAEALSIYYKLPIYVVFHKRKNTIEHFVVKLNNMFLDSDGIQSDEHIIRKIADDGNYAVSHLDLIEYADHLDSSDITKDSTASKKLIKLFNGKVK